MITLCMPSRDWAGAWTRRALEQNTPPHILLTVVGRPVADARNELAALALATDAETIVWADDDAWWYPGTIEALCDTLSRCPADVAFVAASFSMREPFGACMASRDAMDRNAALRPGENVPFNHLAKVEMTGLHLIAMRPDALRAVGPDPFTPGPAENEDDAFCRRLREGGFSIACHTRIVAYHVDELSGLAYAPGKPPYVLTDHGPREVSREALARGIPISPRREYGFVR